MMLSPLSLLDQPLFCFEEFMITVEFVVMVAHDSKQLPTKYFLVGITFADGNSQTKSPTKIFSREYLLATKILTFADWTVSWELCNLL